MRECGNIFYACALRVHRASKTSMSEPEVIPTKQRSWMSRVTRVKPSFLVIGAMRCGTTSLYRYLCEHQRIVSASRKEVHLFDHNYLEGWSWYLAHFPSRFSRRPGKSSPLHWLTGEASPSYLLNPLSAHRAALHLPQAKIIVILRNPVDRAISHYHHGLRRGFEHADFETAIRLEQERIEGEKEKLVLGQLQRSEPLQHYSYCTRGHYMEHLRAWLACYRRDRIHVVLSEEFFADPVRELRRVTDFLGIEPIANEHSGQRRKFNSATYEGTGYAVRTQLISHFQPHNERLRQFLGRDLGWDR